MTLVLADQINTNPWKLPLDVLTEFKYVCIHVGLDPFLKQIHAVPRWDNELKRNRYTFQTAIDGFRLIAERTGRYAPGREPSYTFDKDGKLYSATAFVKKQTKDGTWHEVAATAYYSEYVQTTKEGKPSKFWRQMPHLMLAKCAESLALRKAFPAELSGVRTDDEMGQADFEIIEKKAAKSQKQIEHTSIDDQVPFAEEFSAVPEESVEFDLPTVVELIPENWPMLPKLAEIMPEELPEFWVRHYIEEKAREHNRSIFKVQESLLKQADAALPKMMERYIKESEEKASAIPF